MSNRTLGRHGNVPINSFHFHISGNTIDVEKGPLNIELEVKTNELQTKESATVTG